MAQPRAAACRDLEHHTLPALFAVLDKPGKLTQWHFAQQKLDKLQLDPEDLVNSMHMALF